VNCLENWGASPLTGDATPNDLESNSSISSQTQSNNDAPSARCDTLAGESPRQWLAAVALGEVPPVPPFPIDVLPAQLQQVVTEISRAANCPPDFVAVPMLALAGGAIGNSHHVAVKQSHIESACIYAAFVGRPGSAKSPALRMLSAPFIARQRELLRELRANNEPGQNLDDDEQGPRPLATRVMVADVTTESLMLVLTQNPRGVVMVRDELVELIAAFNQYRGGKGQDRQVYLKLWSGDAITIDRKSQDAGPLFLDRPFCGIVGGLQPAVLADFNGDKHKNDGHLDRWLFCYPDDLPAVGETWLEVADTTLAVWDTLVRRLLALEMKYVDGVPRPDVLRLDSDAQDAWQRFTESNAAEYNSADTPEILKGPWMKLKGYAARLALVLHMLRDGFDETTSTDVDGVSMAGAIRLVAYFKAHARKVYDALDADPALSLARRLAAWLREEQRRWFTRRDAYRVLRCRISKVEDVDPILSLLERHGLIRPTLATGERGKPGRRSSPEYEVHPEL